MSLNVALIMLDGMIAGVESNSSIPIQLSELKTLKILIETDLKKVVNMQATAKAVLASLQETHAELEEGIPAQLTQHQLQPPLRAVPMPLFPTMDSLQQVCELANSQLPIVNKNALHALLATYHNTLLKEINHGS